MVRKTILFLIFIIMCVCNSISSSSKVKRDYTKEIRIAAIHSYNIQHPCGRPQQIGFISELVKKRPDIYWHIENYYMQTRTVNVTIEQIRQQAFYAINFVEKEVHPDFIYVTDDNAFRYVGSILSYSNKVFFSGLNNKFKFYSKLCNVDNVAGVMEDCNVAKLFDLLFSQNAYVFDNIYILVDARMSLTSQGLQDLIIQRLKQYHLSYQIVRINDIEHLKQWLKIKNGERSLLIIVLQNLYDFASRKYYDNLHVYKIISQYNKSNLEVVFNPLLVKLSNISLAQGPDFYEMGKLAADLLLNVIESGRFQHKLEYPKPILACNYERLKQLGYADLYELHSEEFDKIY